MVFRIGHLPSLQWSICCSSYHRCVNGSRYIIHSMYSATFKIRLSFQMPLWLSMHVYSPYLRNMDSFVYTYTVCGASPKWALEYISSAHHVPSVTPFTCKLVHMQCWKYCIKDPATRITFWERFGFQKSWLKVEYQFQYDFIAECFLLQMCNQNSTC